MTTVNLESEIKEVEWKTLPRLQEDGGRSNIVFAPYGILRALRTVACLIWQLICRCTHIFTQLRHAGFKGGLLNTPRHFTTNHKGSGQSYGFTT